MPAGGPRKRWRCAGPRGPHLRSGLEGVRMGRPRNGPSHAARSRTQRGAHRALAASCRRGRLRPRTARLPRCAPRLLCRVSLCARSGSLRRKEHGRVSSRRCAGGARRRKSSAVPARRHGTSRGCSPALPRVPQRGGGPPGRVTLSGRGVGTPGSGGCHPPTASSHSRSRATRTDADASRHSPGCASIIGVRDW